MQDFLDSAKRAAGTAFERAAWEADKMRRSTARQHDVELLQRERAALLEQLSSVVLDLEQRGQITQPPLRALAERMRVLTNDLNAAAAEIDAIRTETFAPGTISVAVQRRGAGNDTTPCPTCHQPVRTGATFCSNCGARVH